MPLLKTIMSASGKTKLAWIVATSDLGNVMVVARGPAKLAVSTKRADYVSINESAAQDEAGWSLDDQLVRALKTYNCQHVAVFVKKPGILFMTDAANYHRPGVVYMVAKNKSGDRIRCVGIEHFSRRPFRAKV